jgi:hypothetical protein
MTRFLSEALNAREPHFRRGVMSLEAANGNPSADIRLTTEVMSYAREKCRELGLDPNDTTSEELYHALQVRVEKDDRILERRLRTLAATHVSAEADTLSGMVEALKRLPGSKACFALKSSKLKVLLRANPPKKAMKALGYRSVDSMLKHEVPSLILAGSLAKESITWHKRLLDQYKKLTASDFEERSLTILRPTTERWKVLGEEIVQATQHNVVSLKELGTIVLLPLPQSMPSGAVTASLTLALHELNEIRATSTFLKVNQLQGHFGDNIIKIATGEAELELNLFDKPVSWNLLQRHYARITSAISDTIFESYVRAEDMVWQEVEDALAQIEPTLNFWRGTSHLAVANKTPVSFNLVDNALNLCNKLPFEKRVNHYFQSSLWQELLLRYLGHESFGTMSLSGALQPVYVLQETNT